MDKLSNKITENILILGQKIIVQLKDFIYLREPDLILHIIVDNTVFDYKTKKFINLINYNIGIELDDGFLPPQSFLILKQQKNKYYSSKILKKKYYGKYPDIPETNNNYFRIKTEYINGNIIIEPKYLMARITKIDNEKKNIDISINKFYCLKS